MRTLTEECKTSEKTDLTAAGKEEDVAHVRQTVCEMLWVFKME